jgi:hypothetical protein
VGKQGRRILLVEAEYHCEFYAKRRRGEFSDGLKTRIKILGGYLVWSTSRGG